MKRILYVGEAVRTGIGSYIVMGFQSDTACTSDIICDARLGEQMKCNVFGLSSFDPRRSSGVNLCLGVRYLNLSTGRINNN